MKQLFLNALSGASGRIQALVNALVISTLAKLALHFGWSWLDADYSTLLAGLIGVGVQSVLDSIAVYLKDQGTAKVQTSLQGVDPELKVDSVPGPATQAAAQLATSTSTLTP